MLILILRNVIYSIILLISLPIMFFVGLPFTLFKHGANKVGRTWSRCMLWCLKHIIGLKYEVHGAENIPEHPAIICSKHQSGWETLALQEIFPLQVYVMKKELFRIPFFGWGLRLANMIATDRSKGKEAIDYMLKQGLKRKEEGLWIVIFPEGTRMKAGERGKYRLGGARMAKTFEMDLVPVAHNSGEYWAKNSFLKHPGTIQVVIGKPISHTLGDEAELMAACENWIEEQQVKINGRGSRYQN